MSDIEEVRPAPTIQQTLPEIVQVEQSEAKQHRDAVYRRWARLTIRRLSREQGAIDWSRMPGIQLMEAARNRYLATFMAVTPLLLFIGYRPATAVFLGFTAVGCHLILRALR